MAFKQEQLKVKERITTKILTLAAEPPTILDPIVSYIYLAPSGLFLSPGRID